MPDIFVNKEKEMELTDKHPSHHNKHAHAQVPKKGYSPVSAYCHYPKGVRFVGADESEQIVLLLRKHPVTNVKWLATTFVLLLVPLVFVYFPVLSFLPERYLVVTIMFWYLVTVAFALEKFLSWYFNVYVVTDERVFDVDFYNLVDRDITDANISDIQDVTSSIRGAFRTALNYGDIKIQTSAEIPEIEFGAVPHPDQVAKILRDLRVEEEQEKIEGRVR